MPAGRRFSTAGKATAARRWPDHLPQWARSADRSSPSAAGGSRWSRATRCSTTTCSGSLPRRGRGSAFCPPRAATPTTTSSASTAPSRPSRCEPSHISLFRREQGALDFRSHLLSQDVIYVGGGSVISLLGVWRAHGIDSILREAWEAGVVLCGLSAGSLCWFAESVSGFHGEPRGVEGLGFLPWSNCVHYEAGGERRDAYRRFLLDGMRPGYAAEDGAALHFKGLKLDRVVASRPAARGWRLERRGEGISEMRLATTFLGEEPPSRARAGDGLMRRILCIGGHDFGARPGDRATDRPGRLAGREGPGEQPRICLLPTASGDAAEQSARFYSRPRQPRLRPQRAVAVPARQPAGGGARPSALPGPDLRRRRQPRQPARGLGGARPRRRSCSSPGRRDPDRRPERRGDVLVRGRDHEGLRRAARSLPGSGCCPAASASTTAPSPSAAS